MFKRAQGYRDDIWIGRYAAHPLTAWTHLGAAAALLVLLQRTPAVDIGWFWLLVIVLPGAWLFITGMLYFMAIMARWMSSNQEKPLILMGGTSWKSMLFRREAFSVILLFAFIPATINWHGERPFDDHDFRRCTALLTSAGEAKLARTVSASATRNEFFAACRAARPPQVAYTGPTTFKELQARENIKP